MLTNLKKEFLKLLDKDKEFRYAVAGYLGLSEILKRLDSIEEAIKKLFEGQNKLWEEVKYLRENQEKMWRELKGLKIGLNALSKAVGRTLEDYTMAYVGLILEERGYPKDKIKLRKEIIIHDKEKIEINIFNEDPLVIGEVKTYIESIDEAKNDIEKLIEKINIIGKIYNKKVELSILSIANVSQNVLDFLKENTEKYGIKFLYGKEIKEEILL